MNVGSRGFSGFRTDPTHIHSVGKVKKIWSVVGRERYYSALAKVRVHFYVSEASKEGHILQSCRGVGADMTPAILLLLFGFIHQGVPCVPGINRRLPQIT